MGIDYIGGYSISPLRLGDTQFAYLPICAKSVLSLGHPQSNPYSDLNNIGQSRKQNTSQQLYGRHCHPDEGKQKLSKLVGGWWYVVKLVCKLWLCLHSMIYRQTWTEVMIFDCQYVIILKEL